jgi:pyruvate/2-oxoglutarate dehydrogenase complex dihydrolipoamide dehydrogenase (E3) component
VVIGAGTAGLVSAAIAAGLGARVALVEKERMGGDCLNVGCVPSKALVRAARAWKASRELGEFGVHVPPEAVRYEFAEVMERMRGLRAQLGVHDSARRFASMGVDVYFGAAKFNGPETIQVGESTLSFSRAVVCTGTRPNVPEVAGLAEIGFLTNENVFNLTKLPERLAVVGGGPLGCELAQCFARFGSKVTVLEQTARILPREEDDAATLVQEQLRADGVAFISNARLTRAERRGREKVLHFEREGFPWELQVDEVLLGVGRAPNVEGLGLEIVGVDHGVKSGIEVNKYLQTTNPRIYAAGDVCSAFKFTHVADAHARIVVQNALFPHPVGLGQASAESLVIPWCTYTDPELAHVGSTEKELKTREIPFETISVPMSEVDRAVIDGEQRGFARVHLRRGSDRILGATIVASHAGDLINELTGLMQSGRGLASLGRTIHPYPTQSEVTKKLADAWRRSTFSEGKKRLVSLLLGRFG